MNYFFLNLGQASPKIKTVIFYTKRGRLRGTPNPEPELMNAPQTLFSMYYKIKNRATEIFFFI